MIEILASFVAFALWGFVWGFVCGWYAHKAREDERRRRK